MPVRARSEKEGSWSKPESRPPTISSTRTEEVTVDLPLMDLDDNSDVADSTSEEANGDGEIVREIDVYLSPELSKHLHLMQFPLQRQHPFPAKEQGAYPGRRDKPKAARIKPRHCMVELDYATRPEIDGDDENALYEEYNGQFSMSTRTFSSQTIPVSTHMALGKLVLDGSAALGLHLIPLTRITQMRPNFEHVNEATLQMSATGDDDPDSPTLDAAGMPRRPLTFQKKESERAAMARKSSYAYKRASEESEVWIPLEVHAERTLESDRMLERVLCTKPDQNLRLPTPKYDSVLMTAQQATNAAPAEEIIPLALIASNLEAASSGILHGPSSSLSSYVQSLNYLPQTSNSQKARDNADATIGIMGDHHQQQRQQDLMAMVVGRMVELMHQGWPIPFSVLRDRFDSSIYSDDVLFQALNVCAFLVRGNFVLQSRLMPLPPSVGQARTFLLFLLQSLGVVHRGRLDHVYCGDKEVTAEVVFMLLNQVATRGSEGGWKLKVDDDPSLEAKYPGVVKLHVEFWRNQIRRFEPLFERYRQTPQDNGSDNCY